ncbi:MAG: zinc ribbon domain-containing protein [Ignavibacteriae bacterium]|nr:zinc ribbon domain-containing protein [Ignavibacteriota bacterium]
MYCRNCGKELNPKAEVCINCGVKPLVEKKFCQECGGETSANQEVCIKCGVRLRTMAYTTDGSTMNTNFSGLPPYWQQEFRRILESNEVYKGKWNWPAFFFSWIWAFTKGAWAVALIILCIGTPFSFVTFGLAGIGIAIFMGIRGVYLYYNVFVKDKQMPF